MLLKYQPRVNFLNQQSNVVIIYLLNKYFSTVYKNYLPSFCKKKIGMV